MKHLQQQTKHLQGQRRKKKQKKKKKLKKNKNNNTYLLYPNYGKITLSNIQRKHHVP